MTRSLSRLLLLVPVLVASAPVLAREAPPNAAEVNAAIAESEDYKGTTVALVRGCFPLVSEEGESDPAYEDWYCAADGKPLSANEKFLQFAIRREHGPRHFSMFIGEVGGACPAGKAVAHEAAPFVHKKGVVGLFDKTPVMMGSLWAGESPEPAVLFCDFLGRLGPNNYQLQLGFTYDKSGYHLTGESNEEVFNDDGKLLDEHGKPLEDQSR